MKCYTTATIDCVSSAPPGRTVEALSVWNENARELYRRWRDSFGAADMSDAWGAQGNFGGDLKIEAFCKNGEGLDKVSRNILLKFNVTRSTFPTSDIGP